MFFRIKGEIKTFLNKQNLREFNTRATLQEMLKTVLQIEMKKNYKQQHEGMWKCKAQCQCRHIEKHKIIYNWSYQLKTDFYVFLLI